MRILPILMILSDLYLHEMCPERVTVRATTNASQVDIDPAFRILKRELREFDQIMVGGSAEESDARRRVGLIEGEVQVDADVRNGHHADEVDVEEVRLGSVRPISWL